LQKKKQKLATKRKSDPSPKNPNKKYLELAVECAKEAGKIIKEAYNKKKHVQFKSGVTDLVTETDKLCEKVTIAKISKAFPDHSFIGEESTAEGKLPEILTDKPTWLIDPIDGTTNFVHRFPFTCISIGFALNKELVVGVVYNPILDELFSASKGEGAYLNGEPLHISKQEKLNAALIATGFPVARDDETLDFTLLNVRAILKNVQGIRRSGSAALDLCYVAAGKLDIYYEKRCAWMGYCCWLCHCPRSWRSI